MFLTDEDSSRDRLLAKGGVGCGDLAFWGGGVG